jgi:hypothetical protein
MDLTGWTQRLPTFVAAGDVRQQVAGEQLGVRELADGVGNPIIDSPAARPLGQGPAVGHHEIVRAVS